MSQVLADLQERAMQMQRLLELFDAHLGARPLSETSETSETVTSETDYTAMTAMTGRLHFVPTLFLFAWPLQLCRLLREIWGF